MATFGLYLNHEDNFDEEQVNVVETTHEVQPIVEYINIFRETIRMFRLLHLATSKGMNNHKVPLNHHSILMKCPMLQILLHYLNQTQCVE